MYSNTMAFAPNGQGLLQAPFNQQRPLDLPPPAAIINEFYMKHTEIIDYRPLQPQLMHQQQPEMLKMQRNGRSVPSWGGNPIPQNATQYGHVIQSNRSEVTQNNGYNNINSVNKNANNSVNNLEQMCQPVQVPHPSVTRPETFSASASNFPPLTIRSVEALNNLNLSQIQYENQSRIETPRQDDVELLLQEISQELAQSPNTNCLPDFAKQQLQPGMKNNNKPPSYQEHQKVQQQQQRPLILQRHQQQEQRMRQQQQMQHQNLLQHQAQKQPQNLLQHQAQKQPQVQPQHHFQSQHQNLVQRELKKQYQQQQLELQQSQHLERPPQKLPNLQKLLQPQQQPIVQQQPLSQQPQQQQQQQLQQNLFIQQIPGSNTFVLVSQPPSHLGSNNIAFSQPNKHVPTSSAQNHVMQRNPVIVSTPPQKVATNSTPVITGTHRLPKMVQGPAKSVPKAAAQNRSILVREPPPQPSNITIRQPSPQLVNVTRQPSPNQATAIPTLSLQSTETRELTKSPDKGPGNVNSLLNFDALNVGAIHEEFRKKEESSNPGNLQKSSRGSPHGENGDILNEELIDKLAMETVVSMTKKNRSDTPKKLESEETGTSAVRSPISVESVKMDQLGNEFELEINLVEPKKTETDSNVPVRKKRPGPRSKTDLEYMKKLAEEKRIMEILKAAEEEQKKEEKQLRTKSNEKEVAENATKSLSNVPIVKTVEIVKKPDVCSTNKEKPKEMVKSGDITIEANKVTLATKDKPTEVVKKSAPPELVQTPKKTSEAKEKSEKDKPTEVVKKSSPPVLVQAPEKSSAAKEKLEKDKPTEIGQPENSAAKTKPLEGIKEVEEIAAKKSEEFEVQINKQNLLKIKQYCEESKSSSRKRRSTDEESNKSSEDEFGRRKKSRKPSPESVVKNKNLDRETISLNKNTAEKYSEKIKDSKNKEHNTPKPKLGPKCYKDSLKQSKSGSGDEGSSRKRKKSNNDLGEEEDVKPFTGAPGSSSNQREDLYFTNIIKTMQNREKFTCLICHKTILTKQCYINVIDGELKCINCLNSLATKKHDMEIQSLKKEVEKYKTKKEKVEKDLEKMKERMEKDMEEMRKKIEELQNNNNNNIYNKKKITKFPHNHVNKIYKRLKNLVDSSDDDTDEDNDDDDDDDDETDTDS